MCDYDYGTSVLSFHLFTLACVGLTSFVLVVIIIIIIFVILTIRVSITTLSISPVSNTVLCSGEYN